MRYGKKAVCAVLLAGCIAISGCSGQEELSGADSTTTSDSQSSADNTSDSGNSTAQPNGTGDTSSNETGTGGSHAGEGANGLSEDATEYEGIEGTGNYNYGEALQKSLIFYELQRSGRLDGTERTNWRGDSALNDGSDNGVDLTGGLYDAGDNVKFNLPMAYTASMLAWSVYEDYDSYTESGQLDYMLGNIKWISDYLIKCHTAENEFYYQVGDGSLDHAWWGAPEVMQMNRPSYKVTESAPGSTVVAEAAAALAATAVVFKDSDPDYAKTCLTHAQQLYTFADNTKSDSGYTAANGFYNSWSGFYDELAWAGTWLYTATGDDGYLNKSKQHFIEADGNYKWSMCWDDVSIGTALRLVQITGDDTCRTFLENSLDYWTTGCNGEKIAYTSKGLAWLDTWGSLRYATTQAFIAACYSESEHCPAAKKDTYWDFAVSQIDYALGSTGRSFVCGFGENYPVNPHHRNAQGSYCDNMNTPATARHTLYGALVGGPDAGDGYNDTVSDYTANEVACDYNAGYTCALAKLYGRYHGKTLKNFGAVEPVEDEYDVEACVNAAGENFTEIKAIVYNKTGWPARVSDKLLLRYFIDLSETDLSQVSVNMGYSQGGAECKIVPWSGDVYCVEVTFGDKLIYPGGQDAYRSEVQFRISSAGMWDPSNDPSYKGLGTQQGTVQKVDTLALYDNGMLVDGAEPQERTDEDTTPSESKPDDNPTTTSQPAAESKPASTGGSASAGGLTVTVSSDGVTMGGNLAVNIEITNSGSTDIDMSGLEVDWFFTKDGSADLQFTCDHSAVQENGGAYNDMTANIKGEFSAENGTNCDTVLKITCGSGTLTAGSVWKIQARVNKADWSNFDFGNDFSRDANSVAVYSAGKLICGNTP
ncbi:MAG: glycoside hydrolase family 9 protein [Eubacterium sp.]|nr:glycoside hydrolase family 9 protein [Eubacterium sp.]